MGEPTDWIAGYDWGRAEERAATQALLSDLLCDHHMRKVDGVEALEEFRRLLGARNV